MFLPGLLPCPRRGSLVLTLNSGVGWGKMEPDISVRWQRLQRMLSWQNLVGFCFYLRSSQRKEVWYTNGNSLQISYPPWQACLEQIQGVGLGFACHNFL